MSIQRALLVAMLATLAVVGVIRASAQNPSPIDHKAIAYSDSKPDDAIARLQARIERGDVELDFDRAHGYLPALLRELKVPTSSQGLVFSRTSLQVDRIAPWTPRAIYFNDDVYIGWVQKGPVIEIASSDPTLGAVFYTLAQNEGSPPRFERQTGVCLMCHDSSSVTGGVPGFIVRSVYPDRYGYVISAKDRPTTDRTPLAERWGGWYVTGTHGEPSHMGNVAASRLTHEIGNVSQFLASSDFTAGGNVEALTGRFDTSAYLTPHSDIAALLVLTHQAAVHNAITRAGYDAKKALYDERVLMHLPEGEPSSPLTVARIERAVEPLVQTMLFVKEAPLSARVEGTSGFVEDFEKLGPIDDRGRSLRQLDLETRLFRYPLSFLIYSESFDALPPVARDYVYRRLREVLHGEVDADAEDFAHLSSSDRKAILEILSDTKPDFAVTASSKQ